MRDALHENGVHVIYSEAGWAVKRANAAKASRVYDTKRRAVEAARDMASRSQATVVVHRRDGRISVRRTYKKGSSVSKDAA